jgi:hypothetical protein
MTKEHTNLPVPSEKLSLVDYLESFLPFRIPRIPLVRTAANLDKAAARLILAKADQSVARIDAVTAKIKRQSKVEASFLKSAEQITEEALRANELPKEVAFAFLEAETKIRLGNRIKIVEEATKQLAHDPPEKDTDKVIDDDWLNMFSRIAEEKSSEELQSLFGKILAGEIREPGSVNLRTLTVVSTLTSAEANKIVEAFKYVVGQRLIVSLEDISGPNFATINLLGEMGIITGIGGVLMSTRKIAPRAKARLLGTKNGIDISNETDSELKIDIGAYFLTEAGVQLFKIAKLSDTPLDYLRLLAKAIADGRAGMSISLSEAALNGKAEIRLISVEGDKISVLEDVLLAGKV